MLAIIGSNKFNYKNKIGEFKYTDIKDLVNNIRNNTTSDIDAEKGLNTLNEIKNSEIIKHKRYIPKQKELLNLFDDLLDAILTDKTLKSKSQKDNTLMSPKDDDENERVNDNDNDNENDNNNDNENDNDNENENDNNMIKELNDFLDKKIDKSKSFEDQIKSIRKVENLNEYRCMDDYGNKELGFKIFKLRLAHLSNIIVEKKFKQIVGHALETLANKLINTTNKEENQTIVKNINKNINKLNEMDEFNGWVIQPSDRCINSEDIIDLILDFNEELN